MSKPNCVYRGLPSVLIPKHHETFNDRETADGRAAELRKIWTRPHFVVKVTRRIGFTVRCYADLRSGPDMTEWDGGKFVPKPAVVTP